ncbi:M23 family metallopeptidase [Polaribacter sp. Z014]|uniref:M23 family metallopeptidase n=1 Tax=Polaribacter sp. Z014 TaxID=2927126 RepID=UPI002022897D|nr:M23 family metallopeptidase [Polaribacter sp. Z014]MCL7764188.1 M23 family metallopeptidase [Polaribacter sp. Z014]
MIFTIFVENIYILKQTLLLFTFLSTFFTFSQEKYPQTYFRNPLGIPTVLAGTFGELRSNHFHSGVDIKTQGREGLKVYAPADGYVSRIKVSQYGYGKALYVTHPNGFTTVYGHLSKYADKIQKYVKSVQYKKELYETGNLFFKEDQFPVKKGEIIAFSGDTGSSGGPHLHFEVRNTKTENIINPLFFGLKPVDTKPPTFLALKVYPLNKNARVNNQNKSTVVSLKSIAKGKYKVDKISASGTIGFSVNVFDQLDKASNKNGIYSLEMFVNGKRYYHHDVETFSFAESKYINLHIDYPHYKKYSKKYQKTYKESANKLSTYKELINNGRVNIKNELNYNVEIIAKDYEENTSSLKISIAGKESNAIFTQPKDTTAYKIIAKNFYKFTQKNVTVAFPKNTFYEDVYLDFKVDKGVAKIHTPTIPLDKSFTLTFNVSKYSEAEKQQLYIANVENPKYPWYQYTRKKDSTFYTTTKTLGKYALVSDTHKPKVNILYFKNNQWISKSKTIKVKISDIGSGIKDYRATLDGKWILMEYNHKKRILTYNFSDKKLVGSKHIFKIVVSDNVGNTNTLSTTFFKKQVN